MLRRLLSIFPGGPWRFAKLMRTMPRVTIDLMLRDAASNDPFFARIVREHYEMATRRHRRLFIVRNLVYGVALCPMPATFDNYFMMIDASARRNYKKAVREGCSFRPIEINSYLPEVGKIRASTEVRQGKLMPENYRSGEPAQAFNVHRSLNRTHDYAYFGAFLGDELIGYSYCLIAGDFCGIEHVLGHAQHLSLGVVPQLIIGMAKYVFENHPLVKYYAYGSYFGCAETMKRFKRKFGFVPHKVNWVLGSDDRSAINAT